MGKPALRGLVEARSRVCCRTAGECLGGKPFSLSVWEGSHSAKVVFLMFLQEPTELSS